MIAQLHVAIISSDSALRHSLQQLLPELWPELQVCGEAPTGQEGLELVRRCQPQLVFCDMPLPDLCGMQLGLGLVGHCHPVFLLERSDLEEGRLAKATFDYLLKPVSREQLLRKLEDLRHRLQQLLPREDFGRPRRLRRLRVLHGDRIRMLQPEAILALTVEGDCTLVHTAEGAMRSNWTLRELTAELDPAEFRPLHRNVVVRVATVERIVRGEQEQLLVKLKGCDRLFPVSRVHSGLLREL